MINLNLTGNGYFAPPGGYPFRLVDSGDVLASGVVRKGVVSVSAVLRTESGLADAHLALYEPPATLNADDGALVDQEDITGLGTTAQTLTIAIPTSTVAQLYVVRLWVDGITGIEKRSKRVSEGGGGNPNTFVLFTEFINTGVLVDSMTVA